MAFDEGGPAGGEAGRQLGLRAVFGELGRRSRLLRARMPMNDSSAGSSVTEAATVRTTVRQAAIATPLRKLSCRMSMPSRAIQTVAPAKTTARPVVRTASRAASATGSPRRSPLRCLVTMNSA